MAYIILKAICDRCGKDLILQAKQVGSECEIAGCSYDFGGSSGGDGGKAPTFSKITVSDKFSGCPSCGTKAVYQCHSCDTLVCHDGKATTSCLNCGATGYLPADNAGVVYCSSAERPVDGRKILLLLDVSKSMVGEPMENAKNAMLQTFVGCISKTNKLMVASFGESVQVEVPLTTDRKKAEQGIRRMAAKSMPSYSPFKQLQENQMFAEFMKDDLPRFVVILTDGLWCGVKSSNRANQLKAQGVKVMTLAFGADADKVFLQDISSQEPITAISSSQGMKGAFATALKAITQ